MTSDADLQESNLEQSSDTKAGGDAPRARRIERLYARDGQFRAARPIPEVIDAVRRPGLRLAPILETLVNAYAVRPAVGHRAQELTTDIASGHTTARLLPEFETISYQELWARVSATAAAWRHDVNHPVKPGDFVATVGFASADYLIVDLVCAYLGLVSVPLQHNAPVSQLRPVIAEVEPRVLAVGVGYLDVAVESVVGNASLCHLVVFDYEPSIDDHRASLARARRRLEDSGMRVVVDTLGEVIERGRVLPPEPFFTGASDERLAMLLYTSGSTGAPKGTMYTERMLSKLWTSSFVSTSKAPVFNVNFMPLNHLGGRLPLAASFLAGGTSYFVAASDMSTLFEDWALVRPTQLGLVPRVVDMLFQHYRSAVERMISEGTDRVVAEAQAAAELHDQVLGGRVLEGFVTTAPLAPEMAAFLDFCLGVHVVDGYGLTEVSGVTRDGTIARPPVVDYKLVDVPDLGYFTTDKPYPRGELLVKTETATPGYFRRPEVTAEVFDHGYYRTGDIMAEIAPDQLVYVDRRNNVLKLAQGEFVAVARLEAVFAGAQRVRQIFLYGNSQRPYLLAVVVPTLATLEMFGDDSAALKSVLRESLRKTAELTDLQSYEIPVDLLVETEPFSSSNGLLSGVGKNLRPRLKDRYGQRLEQLYADLAAAQVDELRALRERANGQPVLDTVIGAARVVLGSVDVGADPDSQFTDLGGDSLSALTFSNLLHDIFDVEVPVGIIVSPAGSLRQLAKHVETQRQSVSTRPTFNTVHGKGAAMAVASDLTLDKFIDSDTLAGAPALPRNTTGAPRTVLLTGANGYLGRFLALEWLQRLATTGGTLICIVRGRDAATAAERLDKAFDSGDTELLQRFRALADDHLEVIAGDIGQPHMGLDGGTWQRLSQSVDMIVHPGAFVNHVLPYNQLFGPNVVGTAEVIRLAISSRIKPVSYLSTVSVAQPVNQADFTEDGDIRTISPSRSVDDTYANGYGNSKWAAEVLLREAFDLCGLPVRVFRSDWILAHSRYVGQLNVTDGFTRLILSLLTTGIAPASFYRIELAGRRPRAHYDGLPADFVAEAVTTLGAQGSDGFRSFDVMNPHDDGVSLDSFVDWLVDAGHPIARIDDYQQWLGRFETALKALPEQQRSHTVLPLLEAYRQPQRSLRGAPAPTDVFRAAVQAAKVGADNDIPRLPASLITKYVTDLGRLGLLGADAGPSRSTPTGRAGSEMSTGNC